MYGIIQPRSSDEKEEMLLKRDEPPTPSYLGSTWYWAHNFRRFGYLVRSASLFGPNESHHPMTIALTPQNWATRVGRFNDIQARFGSASRSSKVRHHYHAASSDASTAAMVIDDLILSNRAFCHVHVTQGNEKVTWRMKWHDLVSWHMEKE